MAGTRPVQSTRPAATAMAAAETSRMPERASVYTPAVIRPMPTGKSARSTTMAQGRSRSDAQCPAITAANTETGRNIATSATRLPMTP